MINGAVERGQLSIKPCDLPKKGSELPVLMQVFFEITIQLKFYV